MAWLLDGDPAVRWRVLRDLCGAAEPQVTRERDRVATEGWGARLLVAQSPDGNWGGGVYTPKWTSTTYTLLHLLWLGLPAGHPAALRGCERLWEWNDRRRAPETCVVSMFVRVSLAFGYRSRKVDDAIAFVLDQQQTDGGWNCAARGDRAKHSSFHTSVLALEALAGEVSTSSWATVYIGHTARARSRSAPAHASRRSRSGISTCSAAWNCSRTRPTRATRA